MENELNSAQTGFHQLSLSVEFVLYLSVETSSHCVRDRDEQEVRHDYHVIHLPEHAHYDA